MLLSRTRTCKGHPSLWFERALRKEQHASAFAIANAFERALSTPAPWSRCAVERTIASVCRAQVGPRVPASKPRDVRCQAEASPGKSQNEPPQGYGAVAALLPVWRTIQFKQKTRPPWPEYRDIHAQKTAMGTNAPDISPRHIVRRNPDRGPESHSNRPAAPMSSFDY